MRKQIKYLFAFIALALISCERRALEESYVVTAKIPVRIDWTKAELDPTSDDENLYRASVWLFAKDGTLFQNGKTYCEYTLDNPSEGVIEVPVGRYSVLILNNSIAEFSDQVGFRGTDKYETFEYYIKADTRLASGENVVLEPDILALWRMDDFEVTPQMVVVSQGLNTPVSEEEGAAAGSRLKVLTSVVPERITYVVHTMVHVKNIKSAALSGATLHGMAHSIHLSTGRVSTTESTFRFSLNNRKFDAESGKDGTIEAVFHSLGPLSDNQSSYRMDISFILVDTYNGSTTYPTPPAPPYGFDITSQIIPEKTTLSIPALSIRIGLDEPYIMLPDLYVPGGFDPDVSDWGDELPIDIPVNHKSYSPFKLSEI